MPRKPCPRCGTVKRLALGIEAHDGKRWEILTAWPNAPVQLCHECFCDWLDAEVVAPMPERVALR